MQENSYYHFLSDGKFSGGYTYKKRDNVIYLYKKDNALLKEVSQLKFMHDDLSGATASEAHVTVHQYFPQNTVSTAIKHSPFHFSIYFNKDESNEAVLRIYFSKTVEVSEYTLTFEGRHYVGDLWLKEISELAAGIVKKTIRRLADRKNEYCQDLRASLNNLDQEITRRSIHCNLHDDSFNEDLECFYDKVSEINRYSDDKQDRRDEALKQCFLSDAEETKDHVDNESLMLSKAPQRRSTAAQAVKTPVAAVDKQLLELSQVAEKLNELLGQNILLKELNNISLNLSGNESLSEKAKNIWSVIADAYEELTENDLYNIASELYQYRVLALLYYKKPSKKQKASGKGKKQTPKAESLQQIMQKEINAAKHLVESIPDIKETFEKYLAQRKPMAVRHLYPMLMGADISEIIESFVLCMRDDMVDLSIETQQIADYFYQHSSAYRWIIIDNLRALNYVNSSHVSINMVKYFDSFSVSFLFNKFTLGDFKAFELFINHGVFPQGIHGVIMHEGEIVCLTLMQMILGVFFTEHLGSPIPFIKAIIASGKNIQEIRSDDFFNMSISLKTLFLQDDISENHAIIEFQKGLVAAAQYTNYLEFFFSRYSDEIADENTVHHAVYKLLQQEFLDRISTAEMELQPNLSNFKLNTLCYAPLYIDTFGYCSDSNGATEECSQPIESIVEQLRENFLQYSLEDQENLVSFFHSKAQEYCANHQYYSATALINLIIIFLMDCQIDLKMKLVLDMSVLRISCLSKAGNAWLVKIMLEQAIPLVQQLCRSHNMLPCEVEQLSRDFDNMISEHLASSASSHEVLLVGNSAAMYQAAPDVCTKEEGHDLKPR